MLVLFGLISVLSFKEFLHFAYIKYDNELVISSFIVNLAFYIGIYFKNFYVLLILFVLICLRYYKRTFIIFAFFITTYLIGSISYIDDLNFIINYLILIELNDVFQYISGNILGKRKFFQIGELTTKGYPRHPLYASSSLTLKPYNTEKLKK